ncbi:ATP-binding protein [Actinomadura craniellae]|nr:AAA family ATPase [Actinomadura craniellae]
MRDRKREWQIVVDLFRSTGRAGRPPLLVEGEPGAGKSLLLAEAARAAAREGVAVVSGRAERLGQLMDMEPLFTALGLEPDVPAEGADRPMRLVRLLRAALAARAGTGPLLVCLDDLHWSDPGTITALRVLPARLAACRVGWILTRCPGRGGAAAGRLFALLEEAGATRVRLGPLGDEAVAEVIADTLGAPPDPGLLELAGQAAGNPLFLVELMRGLCDEGAVEVMPGRARLVAARLPRRARDAVERRLDDLDPAARRLLEIAAVFGRAFSPSDAAEVFGLTPTGLLPALETVLDAGLLTAEHDDLVFRHDLVRQAVAAAIPAPVRQALHRQIGETLLDRGGRVLPAAAHLMAGAAPGDAHALTGLDRAATAVLPDVPRAAADLCLRAFELTDGADPLRSARALSAVNALAAAGRPAEAAELAGEALKHPLPGPVAADLLAALSSVLLLTGRRREAAERAADALTIPDLPAGPRDHAELALLQAEAGLPGTGAGRRARAILAAADRHGRDMVAGARTVLAMTAWDEGRLEAALDLAADAARQAAGGPPQAGRPHPGMVLALLLADVRRPREARRAMARAASEAGAPGHPDWAAGPAILRSRLDFAAGRLDDAVAEARAALAAANGGHLLSAAALSSLAAAALRAGDLETAAGPADLLSEPASFGTFSALARAGPVGAQLAEARLGPRAAVAMSAELYEDGRALVGDPAAPAWLVRTALTAGAPDRAEAVAATADRLALVNPGLPVLGVAAAHARGLLRRDPHALRRAAAEHSDPWARASAAEDLGVLLAEGAAGRRVAVRWFDEALTGYAATGAMRDAARVRGRLRRLGERRRHWERTGRPATGWDGLTETERRVSELVAQGLTNRCVADRLFISTHTVAFHLRQVFRKLDIGSRVELARLVLEHTGDAPGPEA